MKQKKISYMKEGKKTKTRKDWYQRFTIVTEENQQEFIMIKVNGTLNDVSNYTNYTYWFNWFWNLTGKF